MDHLHDKIQLPSSMRLRKFPGNANYLIFVRTQTTIGTIGYENNSNNLEIMYVLLLINKELIPVPAYLFTG